MSRADIPCAASAAIRAACASGRCCPLVGRGLRARVVRARLLVRAGRLTEAEAARIAAEAENVALAFAPLPALP